MYFVFVFEIHFDVFVFFCFSNKKYKIHLMSDIYDVFRKFREYCADLTAMLAIKIETLMKLSLEKALKQAHVRKTKWKPLMLELC